MNETWKESVILGARRKMRRYPFFKGIITLDLTVKLLLYYICNGIASNTKKLVSLTVLLVFYTISCSFCAPMFPVDDEMEQQVFTEHLEEENITLALEETEIEEAKKTAEESGDTLAAAEEAVNPEAEAGDDIDKYSADEILAAYDPEDMQLPGEVSGEVSADDWNLLLVNSRHPIPENYEFTLGTIRGSLQCDERIIPEFMSMLQAAKEDGIDLEVCSPYRTLDRQEYLFDRKIVRYTNRGMSYIDAYKLAARVVNVPGTPDRTGVGYLYRFL